MPKFVMQAEVNCGVTYEVEADTHEQAVQIMQAAIVQHVDEGCDGVDISDVEDSEFVDVGVRMPNHDEPHELEFYDR